MNDPFADATTRPAGAGRDTGGGRRAGVLAVAALVLLGGAVAADVLLLRIPPFGDAKADVSLRGVLRVLPLAAACALLVAALGAWSRVTGAARGPSAGLDFLPASQVQRALAQATMVAGAVFPVVLWVSPRTFHEWALEDAWVEWLSAALLLAGSVVSAHTALRMRRDAGGLDARSVSVALLAAVLFVMAGEEVSWLQRTLGIRTPAIFSGNAQGEMNLHNFATRWTEIAVYVCAGFLLPVLAPAWMALGLPRGPLEPLARLAPGASLMPLGAVVAAYNVNRWNWLPTQVVFWGTLALVIAVAAHAGSARARRQATWAVAIAVGVQVVFLAFGGSSVRGWDVTEYKEMLIAAVLFLYSLQLRQRARGDVASSCR